MLDVIPSQRCSYVLEPIRVRINSEYLSCCTVPVAFVERIVDNYIFFSEQATSANFSKQYLTNSPFENVFPRLARKLAWNCTGVGSEWNESRFLCKTHRLSSSFCYYEADLDAASEFFLAI